MSVQVQPSLASLYEEDETAWLERMADLVAQRRCDELDYDHLSEYLSDMARSEKREVFNRLAGLIAHLLKWEYQPEQRSNSWCGTIAEQQRMLEQLLESGSLRRHASEVLEKAYKAGVKQASADTGLAKDAFPPSPPVSLDEMMTWEE